MGFVFLMQVMIIRGKDKGETGTIKRVIRSQNRVIVEGKNLVDSLELPCSGYDFARSYAFRERMYKFIFGFSLDCVWRV